MHTSLKPRLSIPDFVSQLCETKSRTENLGSLCETKSGPGTKSLGSLCETKSGMESLGSRLDTYHKWLAYRSKIELIKNTTACNHYAELAIHIVIQLLHSKIIIALSL